MVFYPIPVLVHACGVATNVIGLTSACCPNRDISEVAHARNKPAPHLARSRSETLIQRSDLSQFEFAMSTVTQLEERCSLLANFTIE